MPVFHYLRALRAGRVETQTLGHNSTWEHANHVGYLSPCESVSTQRLESYTNGQLTLLKRIANAWDTRDRTGIFRLMLECEAFFDPQKPSSLIHFTGLGGIDLFSKLICDNADWLLSPTSPLLNSNRYLDEGMNVYNTLLRVLTELLVCHNDIGWYIYDRHRGLVFRLLELIRVEKLRDSAIMLLEHMISVVGPIFHIPSTPQLVDLIRTISDGGLASLSRVLALTVVPGVMADQMWRSKRLEPFPQCLTRIRRIQQVVDDNVRWIIEEKNPNLIERFLRLAEVRSSGVRIFQGNRTVTVMVPPEPSEPTNIVPAGVAPASSIDNIVNQLQQWSALYMQQPQPTPAPHPATTAPATNPPPPFSMTIESDDDDDYEDMDDDDDEEIAVPSNMLTEDMLANPAALQHALQQILASVAAAPQTQPPAAATPANTQQSLQSLAESLSQEMHPVNSLDSINFSWFCGRPETKSRWRLDNLLVDSSQDNRYVGSFATPEAFRDANEKFVKKLMAQDVRRRQQSTQKQLHNIEAAENQSIVNSQSEVFFVLNSVMVTTHYTQAWKSLASCSVIPRLNDVFDTVFFINQASTSIHASPANGRNSSTAPLGALLASRFESDEDIQNRANKYYETYWDHPSKMTTISTSAPKDDDFESEGSDEDEETADNPNHRHDPDTLRKLELLRIVHEFINAQDRWECRRLTEMPEVTAVIDDLAVKIAKQVAKGTEDGCTETIAAHALEAYVRCFSFFAPSRHHDTSAQNLIAQALLPHLVEERIFNAIKTNGQAQSLAPMKRIDGLFALLGEVIKYNQTALIWLQQYVTGQIECKSEPSNFAPQSQPQQNGSAGGSSTTPLTSAPLARGQSESFISVLRYRLRRFGVDTNLFLRCIVLSLTPNLTSKINYVWKPAVTPDHNAILSPHDASVAFNQLQDALLFIPELQRGTEFSAIQMERIYYIRRNSRTFLENIVAMTQRGATPAEFSAYRKHMLDTVVRAPQNKVLEDRPIPHLFSESEQTFLFNDNVPLPRAGLPTALAALIEQDNTTSVDYAALRDLERELLSDPAELAYQMLCGLNAEAIENTERLCVVTSTILLFLRCSALEGQAGVDAMLRKLRDLADRRMFQRSASNVARASRTKSQEHSDTTCTIDTPIASQCENFVIFGCCTPHSVVDDYFKRHGSCIFKNFFRLLCIWFGHYSCSQRYVETLYFCTGVPFGEWKMVGMYLWREVPRYFSQ